MGPFPTFQRVPDLGNTPFRLLLLCWLIEQMDESGSKTVSERDLQKHFNRADRKALRVNLSTLQEMGWLRVIRPHRDDEPNSYLRGPKFRSARVSGRNLNELARTLFSPRGILTGWVPSEAWSGRCFGARDLLVLGVLRQVGEPVTRKALYQCLSPILTERSVRKSLHALSRESELVTSTEAGVVLHGSWEAKFFEWIATNPQCSGQLDEVTAKVAREREQFKIRRAAGHLSDSERQEMLRHTCVFCGTMRSHHDMTLEHWPPKAFWGDSIGADSMHFAYPMCRADNDRLGKFIEYELSHFSVTPRPEAFKITDESEALRIFHSVSDRTQDQYFSAYRRFSSATSRREKRKARAEALTAIQRVIGMWLACERAGFKPDTRVVLPERRRKLRGQNAPAGKFRPGVTRRPSS